MSEQKINFANRLIRNIFIATLLTFGACSDADELLDLALDQPSRKPIDVNKTGVNNFFVNRQFGNTNAQFKEIRDTLGLKYVRVLFAWGDGVQPTPNSERFYGFFDEIAGAIPPGVEVTVVLAHTPSWMARPANWGPEGNPRLTWVREWLRPTVRRYAGTPGITAWEVWNEPDLTVVPSDAALALTDPANYMELLTASAASIRTLDPGSLIVVAAPQAVNQNFAVNLNYSKALRNMGADLIVDVWNIHYYGKNYETVVTGSGVADFLNGISLPIWVTESGEQGPTKQLPYVEEVWPFLNEKVPGIDRFYYYEYGSDAPVEQNFGLRTTDPNFPVSDLYIYLRDL